MSRKWLKKYTELEHVENMLRTCTLHLGDPSTWPDKNDSDLIELYGEAVAAPAIRATCLTTAADRFHFWTVFGKQTNGVCFWFDHKSMINDISKDQTLVAGKVKYQKPKSIEDLPFSKRKQYSDEREFRVLRLHHDEGQTTSFSFSPSSLRRIYLNAWLAPTTLKKERVRLQGLLDGQLSHVEVLQSRVLKRKEWIEGARGLVSGKRIS